MALANVFERIGGAPAGCRRPVCAPRVEFQTPTTEARGGEDAGAHLCGFSDPTGRARGSGELLLFFLLGRNPQAAGLARPGRPTSPVIWTWKATWVHGATPDCRVQRVAVSLS